MRGALVSLAPDLAQAQAVDATMRLRLADSFDYLASLIDDPAGGTLRSIGQTLPNRGPVSPWVFCLYAMLVADVAGDGGHATAMVAEIDNASRAPAEPGPVAMHDPATPEAWWAHYHRLLDTDPGRDFRPGAPSAEAFARTEATIAAAQELMARCDPPLAAEVRSLIRLPVLAVPGSSSSDDNFGGASTFFFWGGTLINADIDRTPIAMIDLLVHEASHLLLFGLVEGKALTHNDAAERYASPLRSDPRPIDGIFHACFVAARVEAAMDRLLASGHLTEDEAAAAERQRKRNAVAARDGLRSLEAHARPSERGADIIAVLRSRLGGSPAPAG